MGRVCRLDALPFNLKFNLATQGARHYFFHARFDKSIYNFISQIFTFKTELSGQEGLLARGAPLQSPRGVT